MNPLDLRKKFPVFCFEKYQWDFQDDDLVIKWEMGNQKYQFNPQLRIPGASSKAKALPKEIIDNFVFHLGLVEAFSYWKAFCSPIIEIKAGYLDVYQLEWWHDLLIKGMGQYFYENEIDFREKNFVTFHCHCEPRSCQPNVAMTEKKRLDIKFLIAVGGGKDSAVTLELMTNKNSGQNMAVFALNPNRYPAIGKMVKASGVNKFITAERIIDQQLLQLNQEGYLNGHTPFSSYLAFLSVLMAALFGFNEVVFSNERSSNEGNVKYEGVEINHQYSKTYEFENKFREYSQKYLSDINYFSFLRPLYEIQIAKIFSKMDKYFSLFMSCNSRKGWCGNCPKCLSTFVTLYPFLNEEQLLNIFGKNLLNDANLMTMAAKLLGGQNVKPFECVATTEEIKIAFYLSYKKTKNRNFILLDNFTKEILNREKDWDRRSDLILKGWDEKNNLFSDDREFLRKEIG